MKKYEGLRALYVGSHPLFTKGAGAVHMMKMCQAMTNLGIAVECVLPGRVKKERLFSYYGIKTPFHVTSIALSGGAARRPLHGLLGATYARRKKRGFRFRVYEGSCLCLVRHAGFRDSDGLRCPPPSG